MHHILLFVLILGLIGCGKEETITLTSAKGGKNYGGVFRINMIRGNPNGLDPVIINSKLADDIALQVYDRLISFDSSLGVISEAASSWEISEDGREYVFHIRSDMRFHDNACFPNGKGSEDDRQRCGIFTCSRMRSQIPNRTLLGI
jgi:peptide/nickel transport system substrate-binding protein